MKIALCDDNELQLEFLLDLFINIQESVPFSIETETFGSAEEVLKYLETHDGFDVYILDMVLPKMNGLELATYLRRSHDHGKIMFLTAYDDFVFDAFEVQASSYILKPFDPKVLKDKIIKLYEQIEKERPSFVTVKTAEGERNLAIKDIVYVERGDHHPIYHLLNGTEVQGVFFSGKFLDIIEELISEYGFTPISVGMAVNLYHVQSIKKDSGVLYMDNGEQLLCARTKITEFKKIFKEFQTN